MGQYIIVSDAESQAGASIVGALARHGWLVTIAATPDELSRQVTLHGPPALLICLTGALDDETAEAIVALRRTHSMLLLLVLSDDQEIEPDRPLWLHSDDFMVWQPNETELTLRVRRLMALNRQRTAAYAPAAAADPEASSYEIAWASRAYQQNQWRQLLSPTELRIIDRLERARGQLVSMEDLANCVSGADERSRIDALRVHISRIRKKLEGFPYPAQHIVTVRGSGYRLDMGGMS